MISGANVQKTLIPPNIFLKKNSHFAQKDDKSLLISHKLCTFAWLNTLII